MTQLDDTEKLTGNVITDLQARRDYMSVKFDGVAGKTVSCTEAVAEYNSLRQALVTAGTSKKPVPASVIESSLALTDAIIHANTLIQKMGQLNTARTIEPTTAKAGNIKLNALRGALVDLTTGGNSGGDDDEGQSAIPAMPSGPALADDIPDADEQYP